MKPYSTTIDQNGVYCRHSASFDQKLDTGADSLYPVFGHRGRAKHPVAHYQLNIKLAHGSLRRLCASFLFGGQMRPLFDLSETEVPQERCKNCGAYRVCIRQAYNDPTGKPVFQSPFINGLCRVCERERFDNASKERIERTRWR